MIHLVWHGKGFLVAVFAFGFSLLANLICNYATGGATYWDSHKWPVAMSLFVSSVACLLAGRHYKHRNERILMDPNTGRDVVIRETHSFFFIPIIWWTPILAVWGCVLLYREFAR